MHTRSWRAAAFLLLFLLFTLLISTNIPGVTPADAQAQTGAPPDLLDLLARSTGHVLQRLEIKTVDTLTLIDGRQITLVKAVDRLTGQTVGAAFDGRRRVDERVEAQNALATWRQAHGALAPDLAQKVDKSPAGETFTVAVWLKAQVEALPKPPLTRPASPSTASTTSAGPAEDLPAADRAAFDQKLPARPLSAAEVPVDVRSRAAGVPQGDSSSNDLSAPKQAGLVDQSAPATDTALLEQIESFNRQNETHLRGQVAAVRANFLAHCAAQGLQVQYASEVAPLVFLSGISRAQLLALARQGEIDMIYEASQPGGPLLDIARVTQNADLLENWGGYNGAGVNVAIVEGERVFDGNPFLTVVETRDTNFSAKDHPTAVAGMVASFHPTVRGIARAANLYSANGDDYATFAALDAAMDWGSSKAPILNNSFWAGNCGLSDTISNIDRHMDYLVRYNYDLAVVASGNFNVLSCDNVTPGTFVASPAKSYNALAVGNYFDQNTLDWSDDAMNASSSYNTSGMWKPEIAASGSAINSTIRWDPWTDNTGSGTSYASPMAAGLAANILQAAPSLAVMPETVSAILMASALHNIEGNSALSRLDGAGGIDASAALALVERGLYDNLYIDSGTTFPIEYTQYAYKGETVRFAIRWLANPSGDYTASALPVDLDLKAYRQSGAPITASTSSLNNKEIVEFVAPATEVYKFSIEKWGSWSGSGTYLGLAWWQGAYRIFPDNGYFDPQASPMGTYLAVYPSDWSPSNYWRAVGIRPANNDHDLHLFSRSAFDNPGLRSQLESSSAGSNTVDFIAVDGNHWPAGDQEQYWVDHYSGSGGYSVSRSNQGSNLWQPGWYGPFNMESSEVVKVFDVYFKPGDHLQIQIIPTESNAADLGAALFMSNAGDSLTWHKNRFENVASSNASSLTAFVETLVYGYASAASDYLGLVVYSNTPASGQFYILVNQMLFLPLLRR